MAKRGSSKRLSFCNFKLDTLLEVTLAINENLPTENLLEKYERLLTQKLNIGKLIILAYNKKWMRILESGFGNKSHKEIDVENDLLPIEEITTVTAANLDHLSAFDTIIPVFHNDRPVAYVLIGDIDEEREGVSPTIKHLLFIQTLTNIIIVAIENRRLVQESLRQEAIKRELELASQMQAMLIPDKASFPKGQGLRINAFYLPHLQVGGDYYDFFALNDHEYGFCMSDVSGKGISAAILMSNFQANLKALFDDKIPMKVLVEKLNERVMSSANGEKFITLFIGKYNTQTNQLNYINAGHNPPYFYNINKQELNYLKSGCPGMGMLDEIPMINESSLRVEPGTKLICYTDGLVELKGEDTTDAGMKAVANCIKNEKDINETIKIIVKEMNIDRSNTNFFDDISILGIEFV